MATLLQPTVRRRRGSAGETRTRHPPLLLVANGHASGVRPGLVSRVEAALALRGASCETLVTESAAELAAALADGAERRVVLVGGDGTFHAAANIDGSRPELAIVAAGRANNVARSLGIPLDLRAAARLAVEGAAKPIDAMAVTTPSAACVAVEGVSAGFLSQARSRYREANSGHVASALTAGAAALLEFHPFVTHVTRGGSVDAMPLLQLFVANLPLYGFGLHVAPQASATDGLLDVVAITGQGRLDVAPMLMRLLRGKAHARPEAQSWRAEHVRIDTHGALPVVADSLVLGEGPVDVSVVRRALRVVRP